ncbi:MAG TPA: amidohydrolase family protein, partial [Terriglobales bacterium]
MRNTFRTMIAAVFAVLLATSSFAQTTKSSHTTKAAEVKQSTRAVAIKGGRLLTVSHGVIEGGVLVMFGGKISAVGGPETAIPANAQVIDAKGMTVYPGLIDSETHLGLTEIEADPMTNDLVESSDNVFPQMHTYDAFHAESELIPVARLNGITNAVVAPASRDTLPGQDIFIQLDGLHQPEYIVVRDLALPLNFTGEQRRNESFEKAKFPQTRMGMASQLRQAFLDAQDYERKQEDWSTKSEADRKKAQAPKRDLKLEALLPYLHGKKFVVLAANEPSDVETAVALAREFNLKFVLNHLSHAGPVLDMIAALKVPVIFGPIYEMPKETERYDAVYRIPAELNKRGVRFALASYDAHNSRNLPYAAGYAVAFGLPYDEALRSITLTPAEIWGVADRVGSLDVGKDANVVIATGDPLDVKTDVKQVFIAGKPVPMASRQTVLRDQY